MTSASILFPTGRDLLSSIRDGIVPPPPAAQLLDLTLEAIEEGRTVFGLRPHERFDNGQHAVHGGVLATVIDFAVTTAAWTTLPAEARVVTSNLNITYLRPVLIDGDPIRCEGRVVHAGRRLIHAEASLTDELGHLHATATATCHVSAGEPGDGRD